MNKLIRPKAIIFDMDGTLIDSERLAADCLSSVCAESGATGFDLEKALELIVGRTWESAFSRLNEEYPQLGRDVFSQVLERYQQRLRAGEMIEIPGAKDFILEMATEQRLPLALVSGSARDDVEFVLKSFGVRDHFSVVLGAENYPNSKPAPDGFLKAVETLGFDPSEIWVFEDSTPGIEAGLAAGLTVIALEHANHFGQDQSGAHHLISHFEAIRFEDLCES
jgi:HAD superfamily hydrolase (TIGR01509 family)